MLEPKEKSDEILLADFPSVDAIVVLDRVEQLYSVIGESPSLNRSLQLSSCTMQMVRLKIERTWESSGLRWIQEWDAGRSDERSCG